MGTWWDTAERVLARISSAVPEPVRQELIRTWRRWGTGISLVWHIGGIVGYCSAEETTLLNVSGLWEMMWACIILSGPMAIIVIHWDWIKGLFGDSFKFQALAPALADIRDNGITYKDLYWMEERLGALGIPCPPVHTPGEFNPTDKYQDDSGQILPRWNEFLMTIVPLAEIGDIKKARNTPEHLTSLQCIEADPF